MAKKKRSAARAAAAAVDSEASKKAKPDVHEVGFTVIWPNDTSPQFAKLDVANESHRALRTAKAEATSETKYRHGVKGGGYEDFVEPFAAAVASACAKWSRPVTLNEVITEIAETGCKL